MPRHSSYIRSRRSPRTSFPLQRISNALSPSPATLERDRPSPSRRDGCRPWVREACSHLRRRHLPTAAPKCAKIRRLRLSNPDMLHMSFALPGSWGNSSQSLNTSWSTRPIPTAGLRRPCGLRPAPSAQACRFYGSDPNSSSSRPRRHPAEFTERPIGRGGAGDRRQWRAAGERLLALWNPQASPYRESTDLFRRLVKGGFKTIAFTKARKITELMSRWSLESSPELKNRIAAYRGGYLPEERRELEGRLFGGELDGVISTRPSNWASTWAGWTLVSWWAFPAP